MQMPYPKWRMCATKVAGSRPAHEREDAMNTKTTKTLAAAAIAAVMLSLSFANQAAARISDPFADQKALEIAIVAPASDELSKDGVSGAKAPLIRVAPHACGGGCMRHGHG